MNARAIKLSVVFGVQAVTLSQKKLERTGMREGNCLADIPGSLVMRRRIIRSF
jgi:hypothetical protein